MAWTHSRRGNYETCPAMYEAQYLIKPRPPKIDSDPMAVGREADDILEALTTLRAEGKITSIPQAKAWLQAQVDDWEDGDGILSSLRQDAVWRILFGMKAVQQSMKWVGESDYHSCQEMLYFDRDWQRMKPNGSIPAMKREAHYGGDLDLLVVDGKRARVIDWKTGSSRWKKPSQVIEYGLYVMKAGLAEVCDLYFAWLQEAHLEFVQTVTLDDVPRLEKELDDSIRKIEKDKTFKPNPAPWKCKGCPRIACEERVT